MPYPVADLAGYLLGAWTASRTLEDRRAGVTGTFIGTLTFSPVSETDDVACRDAGTPVLVTSQEEGTLTMPGLPATPARRAHRWRITGADAEVAFEDGRPFHRLDLGAGADEPDHWCAPDQYSGTFTAISPSEMEWVWRVTGPAKDLVLTTRLRRPLPVIAVSAVELTTPAGEIVLVRKRGTSAFMQPGGKPEPGESPLEAARRELAEELGLTLAPEDLVFRDSWRGLPANESGFELYSENFAAQLSEVPEHAAEIEDVLLLAPEDMPAAIATGALPGTPYTAAPLLRERVLPRIMCRQAPSW